MKLVMVHLLLFVFALSAGAQKDAALTTPSGLKYSILKHGSGELAHRGDSVWMHYTGRFFGTDSVFDSSVKRGEPIVFSLGRGRVIKGWDEGIALLHVGDQAHFVVPSALGYGDRNVGPIPANSTLEFDVELVKVRPGLTLFDIHKKDTVVTPLGVKYLVYKSNGKGQKIIPDGKVTISYVMSLMDGTIIDASADRGKPFSVVLAKNPAFKGLEDGLKYMKTGEKHRIIVPYSLAFGEKGVQGIVPPKSTIIFDVELISVEAIKKTAFYDVKGLKVDSTASGLKYVVVSKTNGDHAMAGKRVKVHYTGFFENGKVFDSSVDNGDPIEFQLGKGFVIPGWDEGIALMKVGEKFRLYIPYALAYGEFGRLPQIPAKSNLIFDVELIEVK